MTTFHHVPRSSSITRCFNILLGVILLVLGCVYRSAHASDSTKPNVIVINLDDAGYSDFGFNGQGLIETPRIDRLAKTGVVCTRGYVTASVCTPSRMGLMSGRYQQRFGAECNVPTVPTPGFTKDDLGLDVDQATLGDAMRSSGYRTLAVGKWHLGTLPRYHPNRRGFDEFYGFLGGSRSYFPLANPRPDHQILRNNEPVDEPTAFQYSTDAFTDHAVDFIGRHQHQPFFIYLAYNAVHGPMHAISDDLDAYTEVTPESRKVLCAMTRAADRGVGKIIDVLEKHNLRQNTLIFFLNDNGGPKSTRVNAPLKGFKGTKWEGGVRVPFAVSWPAKLPAGAKYDRPVSTLDVLPTMLAAANSTWEAPHALDGVNLLPYLTSKSSEDPHEHLFWRRWNTGAVVHGDWKLVRVMDDPLQTDRQLILPLMLFNLKDDIGETTNVAHSHPQITEELAAAMTKWEQGLSQPRWRDGKDYQKWDRLRVEEHRLPVATWSGKPSQWNGYQRFDFRVADRDCFVVVPKQAAPGRPWVWRARFPNFHAEADLQLLEQGFHIAHINTAGMLGSPASLDLWDRFYQEMTTTHHLADRVALEAVSRGGLFAYRWAARRPDRVACIYADTPVCDFKSWPLGQGDGIGSDATWQSLLKHYDLTEEQALAYRENPIDVLAPIANAKIPLLHLVSLNDRVVPAKENTFVLADRYRKLGGTIQIIEVKEGTSKSNGHHFDHPDPTRVANFIHRHTLPSK